MDPEAERVEGSRADWPDHEVPFDGRLDDVGENEGPARFQRDEGMVRPADDREIAGEDVCDLEQVERRTFVPNDELHFDVATGVDPLPGQGPHRDEPGPRGRSQRTEGEDDRRRQGEEDDLPAPEDEPQEEEPDGSRGEAARQRRPHVTAPSGRAPARGRPPGRRRSARRGSKGPVSG